MLSVFYEVHAKVFSKIKKKIKFQNKFCFTVYIQFLVSKKYLYTPNICKIPYIF